MKKIIFLTVMILSLLLLVSCTTAEVETESASDALTEATVAVTEFDEAVTEPDESTSTETSTDAEVSELYALTQEYLEGEFHRVFDKYYDIQDLLISNWSESGNEATFFYKMTWLTYNRDPDKIDYIQRAKEVGEEQYKKLYEDYLSLKEANHEFKIVNGDNGLELYTNVSPKGIEWSPIKIDDYVISK